MKRKKAIERGEMFYTGTVCPKHPELNGKRRAKSGSCHPCIVERMRATRKEKATSSARADG